MWGKRVAWTGMVKVARDVAAAIHEAAYEERAKLILLYWKGLQESQAPSFMGASQTLY